MEILLGFIGIIVGGLSGFFGIGGGTILVPVLVLLGYNIKAAVGISVMQMAFSSIYGSWLNYSKGNLNLKDGMVIGFGGFIGALGSGWLVSSIPEIVLESMFVAVVLFALYRFFNASDYLENKKSVEVPTYVLGSVGAFIGLFAISMGIGGSILLTPILVGFLYYPIKKAVSAGLFFVVFSSISGFISLSIAGHIDYIDGFIIGVSSLLGVQIGVWISSKTGHKKHKNALIVLYVIILILMLKKLFGI